MIDAGKGEVNASTLTWRRFDKSDMKVRSPRPPRDQAETLVVVTIGTRGADDGF